MMGRRGRCSVEGSGVGWIGYRIQYVGMALGSMRMIRSVIQSFLHLCPMSITVDFRATNAFLLTVIKMFLKCSGF